MLCVCVGVLIVHQGRIVHREHREFFRWAAGLVGLQSAPVVYVWLCVCIAVFVVSFTGTYVMGIMPDGPADKSL